MSKERRRKQFERLLTRVYSEGGQSEEANGDRMNSDEQMERVVKRMAAANSSIDITVLDDPTNMDGFLALQRALGKYGVSIEEVADSDIGSDD